MLAAAAGYLRGQGSSPAASLGFYFLRFYHSRLPPRAGCISKLFTLAFGSDVAKELKWAFSPEVSRSPVVTSVSDS